MLIGIFCGLAGRNFAYQIIFDAHDFTLAFERTYWQAIALFCVAFAIRFGRKPTPR